MSKKNRKKRHLAEEKNRIHRAQIKALEATKAKLEAKIEKEKKEQFKQFNIRNLKIFTSACNFATPFVISSAITVGVFKAFGGGFPFYTDDITKYKRYDLDYQTNSYVAMNDEYTEHYWYDESLPSNSLIIYSPWQLQDGKYVRFKREYNVNNSITLDLFYAVINEDYNYISENLKDYKEEKQKSNQIDPQQFNDYFFEADFHMLDRKDVLKYSETDLKNIIITIAELIIGLGIGGFIAHRRDFDFSYELGTINYYYRCRVRAVEKTQKELQEVNEKILSLRRTKGGKSNEK